MTQPGALAIGHGVYCPKASSEMETSMIDSMGNRMELCGSEEIVFTGHMYSITDMCAFISLLDVCVCVSVCVCRGVCVCVSVCEGGKVYVLKRNRGIIDSKCLLITL